MDDEADALALRKISAPIKGLQRADRDHWSGKSYTLLAGECSILGSAAEV